MLRLWPQWNFLKNSITCMFELTCSRNLRNQSVLVGTSGSVGSKNSNQRWIVRENLKDEEFHQIKMPLNFWKMNLAAKIFRSHCHIKGKMISMTFMRLCELLDATGRNNSPDMLPFPGHFIVMMIFSCSVSIITCQ